MKLSTIKQEAMYNNADFFYKRLILLFVTLLVFSCNSAESKRQGKEQEGDKKSDDPSVAIPKSYKQYRQIKEGMTYQDVVEIIGSKGKVVKHRWGSKDKPYVDIRFSSGKVRSMFYRTNYKEYPVEYASVLKGIYEKAETGMPYDKFMGLLEKRQGAIPDAIFNTPPENAFSYKWRTPRGKDVTIKFLGGEIKSQMKASGFGASPAEDQKDQSSPNKSSSSPLSYEEYNKLKEGMTYDEVVDIVGSEGKKQKYQWEKEDGAEIEVRFKNGKVNHKRYDPDYKKHEVEYTEALDGLYDKCDERQGDMSHEEFIKLIETKKGEMPDAMHKSPPEFAYSYVWQLPDGKKITIRFENGIVESAGWSNVAKLKRQNKRAEKRAEKAKEKGVEKITEEDYDQLERGAPYDKAVELFGREGEKVKEPVSDKDVKRMKKSAELAVKADDTTVYKWLNPDGSFILVITSDGVVKGKSNYNL